MRDSQVRLESTSGTAGQLSHRSRSSLQSLRALLILALTALLLSSSPPIARAWSNGVNGPNTFGTHDWILREAIEASGNAGSWICRREALRATDDPDTVNGIDHASGTWWHVYDEWGSTWGGAPEAVQVWFQRAKTRLANGHPCSASHALGIMAHLVGDVAQPMQPMAGSTSKTPFTRATSRPSIHGAGRPRASTG